MPVVIYSVHKQKTVYIVIICNLYSYIYTKYNCNHCTQGSNLMQLRTMHLIASYCNLYLNALDGDLAIASWLTSQLANLHWYFQYHVAITGQKSSETVLVDNISVLFSISTCSKNRGGGDQVSIDYLIISMQLPRTIVNTFQLSICPWQLHRTHTLYKVFYQQLAAPANAYKCISLSSAIVCVTCN